MSDKRLDHDRDRDRGCGRGRGRRRGNENYNKMPPQNNFRWKEPQSFESDSWRHIGTTSTVKRRRRRRTGGYINHQHYGNSNNTGEDCHQGSSYKNYNTNNRHNVIKEDTRNHNEFIRTGFGSRQNHQAKTNSSYTDENEMFEEEPTLSSRAPNEPMESKESEYKIKIPVTPKTNRKIFQTEDASDDSSPEKERPPKPVEDATKETTLPADLNAEIKKEPAKSGHRKSKGRIGRDNAGEDRHSEESYPNYNKHKGKEVERGQKKANEHQKIHGSSPHQSLHQINSTSSVPWYQDKTGNREEASMLSPIASKEPIESKEPDYKIIIPAKPKTNEKMVQSEDSSSDSISEDEEPRKTVKEVAKKTPDPNFKVKIKQEPAEKPVINHSVGRGSSSAESSSSESSSSSSDEEIPGMPAPLKHPLKHEMSSNEDVSFVSFLPGDEAGVQIPCIVCNEQGHRPSDCTLECKKCSKSSYELKPMCKNCGEVYNGPQQKLFEDKKNEVPRQDCVKGEQSKSLQQPPHLFAMFMQFMQFCMSQYAVSPDIKYPFPQFESASAPVLGQTPTVEVTQKDIAKHKRKKSESKHRHRSKKARSLYSESSLKTTPTRATPDAPGAATSQYSDPQQQNNPMLFGGQFPPGMVFPAQYNTLPLNQMLAFNQMMNPAMPMNFSNQM